MSRVFAFIFARGGSKGLPRKNVRPLGGLPLIVHSIDVAKKVAQIERIFVSTDDEEIKRISREAGADIIDRPVELALDHSSEIDAWKHAIRHLNEKGEQFDIFLSLPATSPLRNTDDVISCIDALDEGSDAVITVTPASRSPYFNMVTRDKSGKCRIMVPSKGYSRRQDAPIAYDITTVAYVLRPEFIMDNSTIFSGVVKSVVIPKARAVDIDDIYDFKFAESLLSSEGVKSE